MLTRIEEIARNFRNTAIVLFLILMCCTAYCNAFWPPDMIPHPLPPEDTPLFEPQTDENGNELSKLEDA
jgi:hypothetical protein